MPEQSKQEDKTIRDEINKQLAKNQKEIAEVSKALETCRNYEKRWKATSEFVRLSADWAAEPSVKSITSTFKSTLSDHALGEMTQAIRLSRECFLGAQGCLQYTQKATEKFGEAAEALAYTLDKLKRIQTEIDWQILVGLKLGKEGQSVEKRLDKTLQNLAIRYWLDDNRIEKTPVRLTINGLNLTKEDRKLMQKVMTKEQPSKTAWALMDPTGMMINRNPCLEIYCMVTLPELQELAKLDCVDTMNWNFYPKS